MSLQDALQFQARACAELGSPFTATLLRVIAGNLKRGTPLNDRLLDWPGNLGPSGESVPLRLAGSLNGLVLDKVAPDLARCYPPNPVPSDDALWSAVDAAMTDHADRLNDWLNSPPQTNEVARSAVLIAVGHWIRARSDLPLRLSELGASAGLNLNWDQYALALGDLVLGPENAALTLHPAWDPPPPPAAAPRVMERRGVDLSPLNAADPADQLRLCAYVWPDQTERLDRIRSAFAVPPAVVDRGDAADWLVSRLLEQPDKQMHLIYHTVAWQYFPAKVQARARALIEAAGARATPTRPLAWFGMEADSIDAPGAGLTLRLWPGDLTIPMGRADFHCRWVRWAPGTAT